jgi:hypothetical protein
MVSRYCPFPGELQCSLAQLERGGPPRRLGDVLGEMLMCWDVSAAGPGVMPIDEPPGDWPWPGLETSHEFDPVLGIDGLTESAWAVG